jgi:ATP-dependent RNA helicase SUPV3L1/SUV3
MIAPSRAARSEGNAPPQSRGLKAVLGPTNTGKTHLAIERMLAHRDGMIGLPLRLLAREVYDRVVKAKGVAAAALITGEEKIAPESARYFVCTVEAMPLDRRVDFLAVDEIQLARDSDRGHVFTDRILRARGDSETMLLGADAMAPMLKRLLPGAEIIRRERLSTLSYAGQKKLTKLAKRTAIVAFSAEDVYAIAELMRRHRGGAAVVMGALSPRTRNAQVALYQSGEVDFLVATDAIGMGLNMDVDHVAFAAAAKFDGRRNRILRPDEVAQIAGRAGRFENDGSFGETGECPPFDRETIERVESHEFEPVEAIEWRNEALDFSSTNALMRSLER